MIKINCAFCQKEKIIYKSGKKNKNFCNLKCKGLYASENYNGEKNNNFGKKWSEEKKKKQSVLIKTKVDYNYRENCAKANKGKKFSKERIFNMHGNREVSSYGKVVYTQEVRKKISEKSKQKFTEEYNLKQRKIREDRGYWTPLDKKTDAELYFQQADWVKRMFNLITEEPEIEKLSSLGVFNCRTNTKGVVRDHKLSRTTGFNLKIFPEILRHPANCQILTHSENIKKKKTRYIDGDSITFESLFEEIVLYDKFWEEQEKCLNLIEEYKNGKRWSKGG